MATLTVAEVRDRGRQSATRAGSSAAAVLAEESLAIARGRLVPGAPDIFLSHSFRDAELVLGLRQKLKEDYGYSVYVDWLEDPQLDRTHVTSETATTLRSRMDECRSLCYAVTPSAPLSKWMPWECGYFDGKKGRTAILPLTEQAASEYVGQEYLGIYPYVMEDVVTGQMKNVLWVHDSPTSRCTFDNWLNRDNPRSRDYWRVGLV
jgi:hypothetical protein